MVTVHVIFMDALMYLLDVKAERIGRFYFLLEINLRLCHIPTDDHFFFVIFYASHGYI